MGDDYLLESETATELYEEIKDLPLFDPHSHADLVEIVENEAWTDIWEVEAATDHYVWTLMRKRGVSEEKITGGASNKEKWMALAEVFPQFAGNPTYEWIHLDLKRRFGIEKEISAETAEEIWDRTKNKLADPSMRPKQILSEMNVEVLCTTDDPTSELACHERAEREVQGTEILPTWRLDRAMRIERESWGTFVDELQEATGIDVSDLSGFLDAMKSTHEYFDDHGCRASDLGLETIVSRPVEKRRASDVYEKAQDSCDLTRQEGIDFRAFLLEEVGKLNSKSDWVTQLHVGAVRDYRDSLYHTVGDDAGGDVSTQTIELTDNLEYFLNKFDDEMEIVLYSIDPTHYPTLTSISRAFPNVSIGAAWWFNDSPHGMDEQLRRVGTVDLLANHAGMVSDSRKLVSYGSRFEMFRRVLSNVLGRMVERGQMPKERARSLAEHLAYERPRSLYGFV